VEVVHLPELEVTPPVEHFDLRRATARQVQALRFVEVGRWFPPQRDPEPQRASTHLFMRISTEHMLTVGLLSDLSEFVNLRI
jgi:hypothetical protein